MEVVWVARQRVASSLWLAGGYTHTHKDRGVAAQNLAI